MQSSTKILGISSICRESARFDQAYRATIRRFLSINEDYQSQLAKVFEEYGATESKLRDSHERKKAKLQHHFSEQKARMYQSLKGALRSLETWKDTEISNVEAECSVLRERARNIVSDSNWTVHRGNVALAKVDLACPLSSLNYGLALPGIRKAGIAEMEDIKKLIEDDCLSIEQTVEVLLAYRSRTWRLILIASTVCSVTLLHFLST